MILTRVRASWRKDNGHAKQKNWVVVRRMRGYDHHEVQIRAGKLTTSGFSASRLLSSSIRRF
jgi:hypothetical protein